MVVTLVLAVSVLLQFSAAILALRLIRVTKKRTAWALIATAVFLMAVRRSVTLFRLLSGDLTQPPDLTAELVALVTSVLMVAGIARIAPLFHAIRQSEETLRGSQERLRLMVEQMGAILWTTDNELRFTSSQGAGLEVLNLQPDQVMGQTLCEYFQTDDPESLPIAAHHRALRGEPVTYEQTWAGNTYQSHLEPLRDVTGHIVGVIGISLDITERKRAELELLEAERRFRTLLDNVRLVAVGLDQNGKIAYANPHFLALTGYTLDKALGKDWFQTLIPERERPAVGTVFSEIMEAGIHPHYENHILTKEGEERLIAWNNTLLLDPDGKPVGTMGIGEDITERKRAIEALQESEERFRGLVEGQSEALYRMSVPDGKYEYFSPAAQLVFGYSAEDFIHTPSLIQRIIHPDFVDYFQEKWADLVNGTVDPTYEYKIIDPQGNEKWITQSNAGVFDTRGNIIAIEGICRNTTEHKLAEEELRGYRTHLEELVKARTAELKQMVNLMAGREVRMAELKEVIQKLHAQLEAAGLEPAADDPLAPWMEGEA